MAADAGHKRWRKHADGSPAAVPERLKGPEELTLIESTTLMARLRAGFGVGVKADLLTFLLGMRGAMASVSAIARAIGYTKTATPALKITYDPETDTLSVLLREGATVAESDEDQPGVILGYEGRAISCRWRSSRPGSG